MAVVSRSNSGSRSQKQRATCTAWPNCQRIDIHSFVVVFPSSFFFLLQIFIVNLHMPSLRRLSYTQWQLATTNASQSYQQARFLCSQSNGDGGGLLRTVWNGTRGLQKRGCVRVCMRGKARERKREWERVLSMVSGLVKHEGGWEWKKQKWTQRKLFWNCKTR